MKSSKGSSAGEVQAGLEGVVVAETRLSDVDGERGRLVIAGHDVEALAGNVGFERLCALLWQAPEGEVREAVGQGRTWAFEHLGRLGDALDRPSGMDALRAALGHLSLDDTAAGASSVDVAARLTGATAVFTAAWLRRRAGAPAVEPAPALGHAQDLLRMVTDEAPEPRHARALDAYLTTVSDHGMNASTFAARVVASTGSDMVSAVVAAVGALKGPLHGGAPGPVLDMLDAVRTADHARSWVDRELAAGRRIMGMGHRIYRVRDPRAAVFEREIQRLTDGQPGQVDARLALARSVEHAAEDALRALHPDRPLKANVEFFTAVLLEAVGLPRDAFSPAFAVGRVAGWCAHVMEQRVQARLIRPASRYVGVRP
jgi:citrate synthase